MWASIEAYTNPVKQKKQKKKYLSKKGESKLNTSASCMLMMTVPSYLSNTLEVHVDETSKMFDIICDKYDKKGNNKMSSL